MCQVKRPSAVNCRRIDVDCFVVKYFKTWSASAIGFKGVERAIPNVVIPNTGGARSGAGVQCGGTGERVRGFGAHNIRIIDGVSEESSHNGTWFHGNIGGQVNLNS